MNTTVTLILSPYTLVIVGWLGTAIALTRRQARRRSYPLRGDDQ